MKTPLATGLLALFAVAIYFCPGAVHWSVLDRGGFFHGDWWRAFTGHFVHFSPSHLWLDTAVFVVAGAFVESKSRRTFTVLFATSSIAISGAVLGFAPELQFYGGLSGVATAMLFLVALQSLEENGIRRAFGFLVIAAVLGKLAFETIHPEAMFARFESQEIRPAPISHAVGMLTATAVWLFTLLRPHMKWFSRGRPLTKLAR